MDQLAQQGNSLLDHVHREFDLFAAHPQVMGEMLGIVYRAISTRLIHKAGLSLRDGATGAVTLIQRFGSALNLNIHFHLLFLDGVYVYRDNRPPRFQRIKAPDRAELEELVQLISQRVGRCLERQGLLEQDTESAWLDLDPAEDTEAMPQILGSSITYRIAVGPQQGRKAFMIRTIRPLDRPDPGLERVARANGFSLHAGVSCEGNQKDKRERLCRYISRPAVAVPRLSLSSTGKVVYTLKTPYRDGTTQVAFEPVYFVARLAALVPKSRKMELYAAMVDNLDRHVGRLIDYLRAKGLFEQTLVIFMSDNGAASADFYNRGPYVAIVREHYDNALANMGSPTSFVSYGQPWAEASSAPFRRHKWYTTQDGMVSPMLMHGLMLQRRGVTAEYATVMDIAPTLLALAGASYPVAEGIQPMLGASMVDFLADTQDTVHGPEHETVLFHRGYGMARKGRWKIVSQLKPFDESVLELYDVVDDPGETRNLRGSHPEKFQELLQL